MSEKRVAVRYARALVEALAEKDGLDQVGAFAGFCRLVAENAELSALCANVTISAENKARAIKALAEKAGLPDMIRNFLRVIAENGRLGVLAHINDAVAEAMDARNNIQAVQLTTAVEPSSEEFARFKDSMKKLLGSEVRVVAKTNPGILGGAIAQVGSFVYDGSVQAQLTRLRRELIKEN